MRSRFIYEEHPLSDAGNISPGPCQRQLMSVRRVIAIRCVVNIMQPCVFWLVFIGSCCGSVLVSMCFLISVGIWYSSFSFSRSDHHFLCLFCYQSRCVSSPSHGYSYYRFVFFAA